MSNGDGGEDSSDSMELTTEEMNVINVNNIPNGYDTDIVVQSPAPAQPYLEITEQPQARGFRFRYKCEGQSHGGLQGEGSLKGKKTYPMVKIHNYRGPARISVSLVTDEEIPKIHAHELIGKNCKNGTCMVDLKANMKKMEASFPNLGVLHVTKRKVVDILKERILHSIRLDKMLQKALIQENSAEITEQERQNAADQADDQARSMQLNVVRLCCQAYLQDENGGFTKMLPSVISNPIYDCKSPGAAALKICRMDKNAGCCMGGEEVFLLCDKVQKDDIAVRFFEEDEDGKVKWEDFGNFGPSDVHRQYAIVFKTPAYFDTDITQSIPVQVQLKRLKDDVISDSKSFTYYPKQPDQEEVEKKRKKPIFPTFEFGGSGSPGGGGTGKFKTSPGGFGGFSMGNRENEGSGGNGGQQRVHYRSMAPPMSNVQAPQVTTYNNLSFEPQMATSQTQNIPMMQQNIFPATTANMMQPTTSSNTFGGNYFNIPPESNNIIPHAPQATVAGHVSIPVQQQMDPATAPVTSYFPTTNSLTNLVSHSVPTIDSNGDNNDDVIDGLLPAHTASHLNDFSKSRPTILADKSLKESMNQKKLESDSGGAIISHGHGEDIIDGAMFRKPLYMKEEPSMYSADMPSKGSSGWFQSDYGNEEDVLPPDQQSSWQQLKNAYGDHPGLDMDVTMSDDMKRNVYADVKVVEVDLQQRSTSTGNNSDLNLSLQVAERMSQALQNYAVTGDPYHLLVPQRHLVAVQDEHGDNAIHSAVINRRLDALQNIVRGVSTLATSDRNVNQKNYKQQMPLHIAVLINEPDMVDVLLEYGANRAEVDKRGNTATHLAAMMGHHACLQCLTQSQGGSTYSDVNRLNYEGFSPLHLAVQQCDLKCVKLLVEAGANVNLPDGRSGRAALHHAVDVENLAIIGYLILEAEADVGVVTFDGNTPLHIASAQGILGVSALLVAGGADPTAENYEVVPKDDQMGEGEEEEEEEEEEEDIPRDVENIYESEDRVGCTPMDLAWSNDKMLKILRGEPYSSISDGFLPCETEQEAQHTEEELDINTQRFDSALSSMTDLDKLDVLARAKLAKLLDPLDAYRDWIALAEHIGLAPLINPLRVQKSPTKALLDNFEAVGGTITELEDALQQMHRAEALDILEEALSLYTHVASASEMTTQTEQHFSATMMKKHSEEGTIESGIGSMSIQEDDI